MSRGLAAAALLFVAAQLLAVWTGLFPSGDGVLFDPDCYARLLRIKQLLEGGAWGDPVLAALNAPHGLSLHWTRPLDLLILALALPLSAVMELTSALFWAGSAVSPLLGLATIWVLHRAFVPALGEGRFVLAMGLLSIQRGVIQVFAWGRPDHHSLMLFLLAVILALLAAEDGGEEAELRRGGWLGGVSALAIWVSLEGLLFLALCLIALGGGFVWSGKAAAGRKLVRFCAALAVGLALALMVERPSADWLTPELDRLSLVHAALGGLIGLGGLALVRRGGEGRARRMAAAALIAAIGAAGMAIIQPDVFKGPFAHIGPLAQRLVNGRATEFQPLLSGGPAGVFTALMELSALPGAMVMIGLGLWRRAGAMPLRLAQIHAVGAAVFLPAALHSLREVPSLQLFLVIPCADLCFTAAAWARGRRAAPALGVAAALALTLGGSAAAAAIHATRWQGLRLVGPQACRYDAAMASQIRETPGNIMIFPLEEGPAAAWRLGRKAVGGPYHRNEDGIRDTMGVFGAMAPDGDALAVVRARDIGLVMVCKRYPSQGLDPRRLVSRLGRGQVPDWLSPVGGPAGDVAAWVVATPR